jgi:hypothetical protein
MTAPRIRRLAATGLAAVLVTATALMAAPPAGASPLDRGRFVDQDEFDFDCNGTPTHQANDLTVTFTAVARRGNVYYRESLTGRQVWTNLDTGGTYSNHVTQNGGDHTIVDNGDGTITIVSQGAGQASYYDTNGTFVLKDSGMFRFSFGVDLHGTPDDPSDDTDVPDSFQLLKSRTGRSDTADRDFCADLVLFT